MVAENYYYKPSTRQLRAWLQSRLVGKLRSVNVRKVLSEPSPGWKAGCGALLEGGIHFVALMNDLAGGVPKGVVARFPGHEPKTQERHAVVDVAYDNGVTGNLEYSIKTPSMAGGVFQHSSLEGDRGTIVFESNGLYALRAEWGLRGVWPFPLEDLTGYAAMAEDFLGLLEEPARPPYSDYTKAKQALHVVFDAYRQLPG